MVKRASLTADGSGAPQAPGVGAQAVAADQQVLHVLMLPVTRLRLRRHGDGGDAVLMIHRP